MKVITEMNFEEFEAWGNGLDTQMRIIGEGREDDMTALIEEFYPDGITDDQLNNMLDYDAEYIFRRLGMSMGCR